MRGELDRQLPLFHAFCVEDRIRTDHPLRDVERRTDRILVGMTHAFDAAYSRTGRPGVPLEKHGLAKACFDAVVAEAIARDVCSEFFRKLESRKIEPHIPLVQEPADPKSVNDRKRLPGIRARRRMKRRIEEVGYGLSQKCRKKVEDCFAWLKSVAGLGRSRLVGRWKLLQLFRMGAAAFNLVRLRKLSPVV